jgi:hypothetical protein
MQDLEDVDVGMVLDMITEKYRDTIEYPQIATKEDFINFRR